MRRALLHAVLATVRLWTRVYTAGVPTALRDARREEIESDLWEAAHDSALDAASNSPLDVIIRLVTGIPDDLGWRLEVHPMEQARRIGILVVTGGGILALWAGIASWRTDLAPVPTPARHPLGASLAYLPAPPPPPPPPRSPFDAASPPVTFTYGRASYTAVGNVPLPKRIKDARPVHAPMAVAAGVNGTVVIEATVDETGRVADWRIVRSVPMLDQTAVDAVRQWEFQPTRVGGEPVPVVIRVTVDYP